MKIDLADETAFIDMILKNTIRGASIGDGPQPINQGQGEVNANPVPPPPNEVEEEEEKKEMAKEVAQQLKRSLPDGGWFQSMFGRGAGDLVKDLRMARREHKDMRDAIDYAIDAIRIAKKHVTGVQTCALPISVLVSAIYKHCVSMDTHANMHFVVLVRNGRKPTTLSVNYCYLKEISMMSKDKCGLMLNN